MSDTGGRGPGVDAKGNPVIDPTENVKALSEAANKRQDDLREFIKQLFDRELAALRRELETFSRHQRELDQAESARLDSIRQVDREDVAKTAVTSNTAIATLAKQTTDLATTLQRQVSDTAAAAEARSSAQYNDTQKRLQSIELQLSEGKGKQAVADPQLADMVAELRKLTSGKDIGSGKDQGISLAWFVLMGLLAASSMLYGILKP